MAPEPQGCPSPLPLGPPASPLLLSYPHHPGMGIQPPLPGQRQSLGALPQEMRPHGKQGTLRTAGLVDPEALSYLPLKTLSNQKRSKRVPRCQFRSAASVKQTEEFSTEPLPFLLALEHPNYPGLVAVLGPVLKGGVTHWRVLTQVTGSAPTTAPTREPRMTGPTKVCSSPCPPAEACLAPHPMGSDLTPGQSQVKVKDP